MRDAGFAIKSEAFQDDVDYVSGPDSEETSEHAPSSPPRRAIIVIDTRKLTLECFTLWLASSLPEFGLAAASSVDEALAWAASHPGAASMILLNLSTSPISDPGVTAEIAQLRSALPSAPILVIADQENSECVLEALDRGVRAYIPTNTAIAVVVGAIRLVQAGGVFVPSSAIRHVHAQEVSSAHADESDDGTHGFTPRQMQVLACLREGKPNKVIAYQLKLCESTVKVHVRHIMKKLGATNRTQVAFLTGNLFDQGRAPA